MCVCTHINLVERDVSLGVHGAGEVGGARGGLARGAGVPAAWKRNYAVGPLYAPHTADHEPSYHVLRSFYITRRWKTLYILYFLEMK